MNSKVYLSIICFLIFALSFSQEDNENSLLAKANAFYTNGQYSKAAEAFNSLYELNQQEEDYMYYAAVSAVTAKDYKSAIQYYLKLRSIDYDGIKIEYFATNKESKNIEIMSRKVRDSLVKTKLYKKPRKRKTKSKTPEITKNIALIYIELGESKKALEAIKVARMHNPKESELSLTEANIYYKLGNISMFQSLLEKISKKERKNVDVLYNLGVLSAQSKNEKGAVKYYKKVIKLDSKFVNAYINLSALILSKELGIVEEMNTLGMTWKANERYDKLKICRMEVFKEALPYLEKVIEIDNKKYDAINTLLNVYVALEQSDKAEALKSRFNL